MNLIKCNLVEHNGNGGRKGRFTCWLQPVIDGKPLRAGAVIQDPEGRQFRVTSKDVRSKSRDEIPGKPVIKDNVAVIG